MQGDGHALIKASGVRNYVQRTILIFLLIPSDTVIQLVIRFERDYRCDVEGGKSESFNQTYYEQNGVAECTVLEPLRYLPWPFDSILEAVLTVSPNRQYRGMVSPTTPAAQGPVCSPIRSCSLVPGRCLILNATVSSSRSSAIFAISAAWRSSFRTGTPDTHMYASPIVST